jgi:hypothetical protein
MDNHRLFRGQNKKYANCLFVPSALRGYWSGQYHLSDIGCCNACLNIPKVEKFLQDIDIGIDINAYKNECSNISKQYPFQDCDNDIPFVFWLSIVFCEYKYSHMGKNTSFSGTGCIPYPIDMGFKIDSSDTIAEYAMKISKYYFEHTPPILNDNFLRISMAHQHYYNKSVGYNTFQKGYRTRDGNIIDGNDLPDHFTLLLDWTEDKNKAKEFAENDGTIVSIDSKKYDSLLGNGYKMSHNDPIIKHHLINTIEQQKSVVTFWPWTFTINQLEHNDFGKALGFKRE